MTKNPSRRDVSAAALAAIAASVLPAPYVRAAEKKYDAGASDTEIKIGQTVPHSGPGSLYGVLAFTLETHDGTGIVLGEGLRYAHSAEYVRGTMAKAGFKLLTLEPASPRIENNEPVRGLVVVAEKT